MVRWSYLEYKVSPEVASRLLQGYAMRVYCLMSGFVLPGIAESSTIYVTSDLVPLSAHVREQVHNWRYTTPLLFFLEA